MDESRPLRIEDARDNIPQALVIGPEAHAPEGFDTFEEHGSDPMRRLREIYAIDWAVAGETSEFRRLLKLRHWVHRQWPIDDTQTFSGDALAILEQAKTGVGFHCAHCMVVQRAVLSAFGFVARNLGVDRDHRDRGRSCHHGVNEVWSNDHAKWVVLDAKYDIHFEREGVPLSALELHEAVRADGGRDVTKVQGIERTPLPMENPDRPEGTIRSYWWVSYHTHPNAFPRPDWQSGTALVVFDNPAFRENTWYRQNGEKQVEHWAYAADMFLRTRDRHQIEWTPGVPMLRARQVSADALSLEIRSATPGFAEYRVRIGDGSWQSSPEGRIPWRLERSENTLEVRSRNRLGVEGPPVLARVSVR